MFRVRDLSDGKFKVMTLSRFAFRTLANVIGNLEDHGENPSKYDFVVTKKGEGMRTMYDIIPKKRHIRRKK
jgi:hypothetical protein